jgi:Antibiotic biosynthesis monooxygenase
MALVRITQFTVNPADADEMLARRAALISAVRAGYPGLTEARLARVDEQTWIDIWRWDSAASLDAALSGVQAGALAEAPRAFALATNTTADQGEIVDER